jgi:hypothetical protein
MALKQRWSRILVVLVALGLCGIIGWQTDATPGKKNKNANLKGIVTDSHDRPVVGATVYFIDSSTIDQTPITQAQITDGSAENRDEPLEDIVRNEEKAKTLPQAKTNSKGQYSVKKLNAAATYFPFVVPDAKDTNYLPGGDQSRFAFSPKGLLKGGLKIQLSWRIPADATFIGTTACYVCHGPAGPGQDVSSNKHTGHALMFHRPGQDTANQDSAHHVGADWNALPQKFNLATQAAGQRPVAASGTTLKTLSYRTLDKNKSAQYKLEVFEDKTDSTDYLRLYLWKADDTHYKITMENMVKPTDPKNFVTLDVVVTLGGYIRQMLCVKVPDPYPDGTHPGLKGLYRFLGYQAIPGSSSQGLQSNYDRARRPWVSNFTSVLSDFFTVDSTTASKSVLRYPTPSATATEPTGVACANCHLGMGEISLVAKDPVTNEWLTKTIPDPNGVFDIDGDGSVDDVGVSCEQCHGPGSKHREENLKAITGTTSTTSRTRKNAQAEDTTGKFIVNPKLLCADRASLICGRCHGGRGILVEEDACKGAPPGISRAEFLHEENDYVIPTHKGLAPSQLFPDGKFPQGGHQGGHYTQWLTAKHGRNTRRLVACDDCHDAMGDSSYRYSLKGDPDDSQTGLCSQCHTVDVTTHVPEKTGSAMMGAGMKCIDCHMPRTGRAGAGRPGLLLGTPDGLPSATTTDANIIYWENDQSAHIWLPFAHKFDVGVAGVQPGGDAAASPAVLPARPSPYTNSCGTCHDASKLKYQAP